MIVGLCMPIKYNLTKYDLLADDIHELANKKESFSKEEEILRAEATLIASFASSHSWQTHRIITEGNVNQISSSEIKGEYETAKKQKWKNIRNTDIQEVACKNIRDGLFFTWLSANTEKEKQARDLYKNAWIRLKEEFDEECDGISAVQR
jgi:hypothetical protein